MAVKLHRCSNQWVKIKAHPCWRVEKALMDMGVEYERVPGPSSKAKRDVVFEGTAQRLGGRVARMAALPERRLVAVMFTDMAGYTALMQADEKSAVAKRDRYVSALERGHEACGGTIVQRLGDGSLSMFPSALAAVRAAVAMQRELAEADVPVRIGIPVGDVLVEPERLTG